MDEATKQALLDRFRVYLDCTDDDLDATGADHPENGRADGDARADLYQLFVELAGLRSEVRTESRLVKEALDQSKATVEPLRSGMASLERSLKRAEAELETQERRLLKPLLLGLLEVRDRLEAGLETAAAPPPTATPVEAPPAPPPRHGFWERLTGRGRTPTAVPAAPSPPAPDASGPTAAPVDPIEAWRAGLAMTLRRFDALLSQHDVEPILVQGQPFDPRTAKAIGTEHDPSRPEGSVLSQVRPGFRWRDSVLRPAEVVVNKTAADDAQKKEADS